MEEGDTRLPDNLLIESVFGGGLSAVIGSDDEEGAVEDDNKWYSSVEASQPRKQRKRGRRKKEKSSKSITGSTQFERDPSDMKLTLILLYERVAPTTKRILEKEAFRRNDPALRESIQRKNEDDLCRMVDEIVLDRCVM